MFKVTKVDKKKSDWYVIEIVNATGEIISDISVNRQNKKGETFPGFDEIVSGASIEGQLWQSPKGNMYLFAPKEKKEDRGPAAREAGLAEIKNILTIGEIAQKLDKMLANQEEFSKELMSISAKVFPDEVPPF